MSRTPSGLTPRPRKWPPLLPSDSLLRHLGGASTRFSGVAGGGWEFNSALAQSTPPAALSETELGAPLDALLDQLPSQRPPLLLLLWLAKPRSAGPSCQAVGLACPAAVPGVWISTMLCTLSLTPGGAAATASRCEPAIFPNQQLGLRLACNMFKQASTRAWVVANRAAVLDAFAIVANTTNKGVRVSMATLLYNFVILSSTPGSLPSGEVEEAKMQMLSALSELLTVTPLSDIDSTFRALVAVGTLCHKDVGMCSLAKDLGVQDLLKKINDSPEAKTAAGRKLLEAAIDVSIVFRS
eukprot:gene25606-11258_t